jgi:hypothetical protein
MQRRVVDQILRDREVEVERARLEHDADAAERLARRAGSIAKVTALRAWRAP